MNNHKRPPTVNDILEPYPLDAVFDKVGATVEWIGCQWWELAHANKVVTASFQGKILDERTYADNTIREKALDRITALRRLNPAEKVDFTHHLSKTAAKIMQDMDGESRGKLPCEMMDIAEQRRRDAEKSQEQEEDTE